MKLSHFVAGVAFAVTLVGVRWSSFSTIPERTHTIPRISGTSSGSHHYWRREVLTSFAGVAFAATLIGVCWSSVSTISLSLSLSLYILMYIRVRGLVPNGMFSPCMRVGSEVGWVVEIVLGAPSSPPSPLGLRNRWAFET